MVEVPDEVVQTADREEEDEKQEEKTLYELDNLYRTKEKRLNK